jgi:hypothetical protein
VFLPEWIPILAQMDLCAVRSRAARRGPRVRLATQWEHVELRPPERLADVRIDQESPPRYHTDRRIPFSTSRVCTVRWSLYASFDN